MCFEEKPVHEAVLVRKNYQQIDIMTFSKSLDSVNEFMVDHCVVTRAQAGDQF